MNRKSISYRPTPPPPAPPITSRPSTTSSNHFFPPTKLVQTPSLSYFSGTSTHTSELIKRLYLLAPTHHLDQVTLIRFTNRHSNRPTSPLAAADTFLTSSPLPPSSSSTVVFHSPAPPTLYTPVFAPSVSDLPRSIVPPSSTTPSSHSVTFTSSPGAQSYKTHTSNSPITKT